MSDEREGPGSGSFVDVARNPSTLVPRPARVPDERCVHRAVMSGPAARFSAQRGHPVHPVVLPSTAVSLSVGELAPGAATADHRHAYEALMYVMSGRGHSIVEGRRIEWQAGDAVYTPPWCWHRHIADDDCAVTYITATNQPLLASLGQTVMRDEPAARDG